MTISDRKRNIIHFLNIIFPFIVLHHKHNANNIANINTHTIVNLLLFFPLLTPVRYCLSSSGRYGCLNTSAATPTSRQVDGIGIVFAPKVALQHSSEVV